MKALILNSGLGSRMGDLTKTQPKCMTDLCDGQTILSRQLNCLSNVGVKDVVITTGYYDKVLIEYCESLNLDLKFTFIKNPLYDKTNYIYSIFCAKEGLRGEDIVMMHGDLVFESKSLESVINNDKSCMTVSSLVELPEKDFKAVLDNDRIIKVGIEFFENAVAAQPLYKINAKDWEVWLDKIIEFCENKNDRCYAENAFNDVSDKCEIYAKDILDMICMEVDTPLDLEMALKKLRS